MSKKKQQGSYFKDRRESENKRQILMQIYRYLWSTAVSVFMKTCEANLSLQTECQKGNVNVITTEKAGMPNDPERLQLTLVIIGSASFRSFFLFFICLLDRERFNKLKIARLNFKSNT